MNAHSVRTLLVAGATGLVGRELVAAARADGCTVHALARRVPGDSAARGGAGVHWIGVDFAALPPLPAADAAACALGTTIKVAGSQAAFRAVDHDAVLAFARAAHRAGVRTLGVVSALGANARSSNFYSRVKGEAEEALAQVGFASLVIVRPSLLVGDREALGQPVRRGERIGLAVSNALGPLIPSRFKAIDARRVARALLVALADARPGVRVVDSGEAQRIGA